MNLKLKDKVAIVTGGGSGIGKATSILFAKEGAKVVVVDCDTKSGEETTKFIKEQNLEAMFIRTDVSNATQVKEMMETVMDNYGRLDILFNNAGVVLVKPLTDTAEEEWDKVININLKSVFLCSKYAIPIMIKTKGGSIINVSSVLGLVGSRYYCAYSSAKGGIISLTKAMASEYASYNIRVNCICPGTIATPMTEQAFKVLKNLQQKQRFFASEQIPLGRMGEPREVAYVALFLASDESSYITGAFIPVGGGAPYCRP